MLGSIICFIPHYNSVQGVLGPFLKSGKLRLREVKFKGNHACPLFRSLGVWVWCFFRVWVCAKGKWEGNRGSASRNTELERGGEQLAFFFFLNAWKGNLTWSLVASGPTPEWSQMAFAEENFIHFLVFMGLPQWAKPLLLVLREDFSAWPTVMPCNLPKKYGTNIRRVRVSYFYVFVILFLGSSFCCLERTRWTLDFQSHIF